MDAVERLNRFKEEYKIRERKQDLYSGERVTLVLDLPISAGVTRLAK